VYQKIHDKNSVNFYFPLFRDNHFTVVAIILINIFFLKSDHCVMSFEIKILINTTITQHTDVFDSGNTQQTDPKLRKLR
jgi:hypothetical protein